MFIADLEKQPESIDLSEEELKAIIGGDGSDPNNAFEPVDANTDVDWGFFEWAALMQEMTDPKNLVCCY